MWKIGILQGICFYLVKLSLCDIDFDKETMENHRTIYDFSVKDANGKEVSLSKYRGNVVVIVNVASECGYTYSNYNELKELMDKYYDQGLRVAAFPCNQFGSQEPGSEDQIISFVKKTFEFEPDLYAKIDVNGENADPFWQWLKQEQGGTLINAIKWNFTKFLVDKQGYVRKRYAPTTSPAAFEAEIVSLLTE